MNQVLYLVLFAEGAAAFCLMVKIRPLQELAMRGIDQLKTGMVRRQEDAGVHHVIDFAIERYQHTQDPERRCQARDCQPDGSGSPEDPSP